MAAPGARKVSLTLVCAFFAVALVPTRAGAFERAIKLRAKAIHKAWEDMYGLSPEGGNSTWPPEAVVMPMVRQFSLRQASAAEKPAVPWAPHLEECALVTRHRQEMENISEDGEYPPWACTQGSSPCNSPKPPWVRGADEDNLALTRVVQRDIWAHQFPTDCSDAKHRFLLVGWKSHLGHGLGAQLHIMSVALSIALSTNRILVPAMGSFQRANHAGCGDKKGSLECYFFPITSPECVRRAYALKQTQSAIPEELRHKSPKTVANSSMPVVVIKNTYVWTAFKFESSAAERWGKPWAGHMAPFELLGASVPSYDPKMAQVNWWRSQSVRFMLRWPSAYLCHLMNRARHEAYGLRIALRVATSESARESIEQTQDGALQGSEAAILIKGSRTSQRGTPLERMPTWRFPVEPYVLRPIISIHVRQGDKAKEMKLFSLPSFIWLANRIRLHVPDVHYVWLSSEMQTVIDDAGRYKDWTFLYTKIKRQVGSTAFNTYEKDAGPEQITGSSFVNLLIASQCDYFVGTLGSNWNRLINELRLTNGRLHASYMTLNNNEW